MPNPVKLDILRELRESAGLNQAKAAKLCGLTSKQGRLSLAAWEQGESIPRATRRAKFMGYLWDGLGLRNDAEQFERIWETLVNEWRWDPIEDREWARLTTVERPQQANFGTQIVVPAAPAADPVERLATMSLDEVPSIAPIPPSSRMPYSRNPLFVGRTDDLRQLARALKGGETIAIGQVETTATTGLGGIGKTQLASEFVHRYGQYFAGGVYWLSFADPQAVPAEIAACGGPGLLDLRPDFNEQPLDTQVELVQAAWRESVPRLLVFDNCEDEALLAQWRPTSGGCRVLITSRRAEWSSAVAVQSMVLNVLARDESIALLKEHVPNEDDSIMDAIAEELGDLPLALHLAGSYLARYCRVVDAARYLEQVRNPNLLEHRSLQGDAFSPTGHIQNVSRTIAMSYDQLDQEDEVDRLALDILGCMSCLASGEPAPLDLIMFSLQTEHDYTEIELDSAILRLFELGLVQPGVENKLWMHQLTSSFVYVVTSPLHIKRAIEKVIIQKIGEVSQSGNPQDILGWLPHLIAVVDKVVKDETGASLQNIFGDYLWQIGRYASAQVYFEQALSLRCALLGNKHPDTAQSYNDIGLIYQQQGSYIMAEQALGKALQVRRALYTEPHPDLIETLSNYGILCFSCKDYSKALSYFSEAHSMAVKIYGTEHPATAEELNSMGRMLQLLGDLPNAQIHLQTALKIWQKSLDPQHPLISVVLTNLGVLMQEKGDFLKAESYLENALSIRRATLGEDHPETATTLHYLGDLYRIRQDFQYAYRCYEQALDIRKKFLRPDHPLIIDSSKCLTLVA